jgi:hypothetical protein
MKWSLTDHSSQLRELHVREQQQRACRRAMTTLGLAARRAAVLVAVACAAGALAAPASARPTVPRTPAAPGLMVSGRPVALAADPTTRTFWVAELSTGHPHDIVNKITETSHSISTFKVTSGVSAIAADPTRGLVWTIGNSRDGSTHTVTYINESTNSVKAITLAASSDLTGIAIDAATGTIFVLDRSGDVYAIDEADPTFGPLELITGWLTDATDLAVDDGTGTIWVVDGTGDAALAFNESTGDQVGSPVPVGTHPGVISIDTTRQTVWVSAANSTITEFSEASPGTRNTITLGSVPVSIQEDSTRGVIWVGAASGSIYEINEKTSSPSVIGRLTLPEEVDGLATDPGTGQLWATEDIPSQGTFDNVFPYVPAAPAITSASSSWFATNNSAQDTFPVVASGFPPAAYSISGAPSWLTIGADTGVLSAALTSTSEPGATTLTITATNGMGTPANQSFTAKVGSDPVVETTSATFAYGVPNSLRLKATGVPAAITFQGLGLPRGITLSRSGVLSGRPAKGAKSPAKFVILARNAVTRAFAQPTESVFTLTFAPGVAPKITSSASVTFKHGKPASFTIRAKGLPVPALTKSGKLPKGLKIKFGNGTALISGAPAIADKGHSYKITITAKNGVGKPATQAFTIKVT